MLGTICIVHPSPQAALRLADALARTHVEIHTFVNAEALLAELPVAGCILVAAHLGGVGARGLLAAVRARNLPWRVIALVHAGEVALAAELLRAGAADVVEEGTRPSRLLAAVRGGTDNAIDGANPGARRNDP